MGAPQNLLLEFPGSVLSELGVRKPVMRLREWAYPCREAYGP